MRTHLFSTAITTKAAVTAATVVLIGGGAALADTVDGLGIPDEEEPVEAEEVVEAEEDDGDAYALGREDQEQDARTADFCATEDTDSPRCDVETSDEDELDEEALGLEEEVEVEEEGEGERSETAQRVHDVLNGDTDLQPGDPGFGQAVSSQAKGGGLGQAVSSAARGDGEPDALEEEIESAEAGGPPDHAKARGRR